MKRIPLLLFVISATLSQLLADAAAQICEEARAHTPEYWRELRAEERDLGLHAYADDVAYQDTDAGMWESGE